jgi:arsenite-transporting ATPase
VGKTTVAAAIALALARRGLPVTLTTTDPAAHIGEVLPDPPVGLTLARIDPHAETAAYQQRVMDDAGAGLDATARDLLAEDLRSPCTEEVAVFHAFARTVADAADRWVVIDTAPTGHSLLLLQSAYGFSTRTADDDRPAARLYRTLSDPDRTRIVLMTLPEATPVHEARALQDDLARTGLIPWVWLVNQALSATGTTHAVLRARADDEARWIAEAGLLSSRPPVVLP